MKILLTALLTILLLSSCQKEVSFNLPPSGGGTSGELLVKIVAVTGSESITTVFTYDNQKRLETTTIDGTSGGITLHNYTKLERDGAGRISRILQKADQSGISSDTAFNLIHYPNATTLEYDYSLNSISLMGLSVIDSAVYAYTTGKMTSVFRYLSSPLLGSVPIPSSKYDFTYDGSAKVSNLSIFASLSPTGGTLTPLATEIFTYGKSSNYLWATTNAAQNFLIIGLPNAVNSLVDKLQINDLTTPSNSTTVISTYVFDGSGKPTTATLTTTSTGQAEKITKYTFYYQ